MSDVVCPLCSHRFDPAAHPGCGSCPLASGCVTVCCPACGHTTIDPSASWSGRALTRLLRGRRRDSGAGRGGTLADAPAGALVRVRSLEAIPPARRERLHAYGLLPGSTVRVVASSPVTVVDVERTELAFEAEIARGVAVAPADAS
jgi:Fe2+ transport system protein FeoA